MARVWICFLSIIKSIRNKIIVLALAVLVGLVALETFLWIASGIAPYWARNTVLNKLGATGWGMADQNKYDPICYFLPRGGFFRSPDKTIEGRRYFGRIDRPLKKEEHTIRIMCIGDSTTHSLTVDYYDSWVYLLGTMLSKKYPEKKIEALNAGIAGSNSKQIKRVFQFYLSKYRSDIVIWRTRTGLNDTYFVDTTPDFARYFLGPFLYKFRTFRLFCVLADSGKKAEDQVTADKIYDFMTGRNVGLLEPYTPAVGLDSDFSMVQKIAQDHGTKYVLKVEYLWRESDGRIRSEAQNNNNEPLVKVRHAFEENDAKSLLPTNENRVNLSTRLPDTLFVDSFHLTEKGEAITAEEIYKFIVENKWIETLG